MNRKKFYLILVLLQAVLGIFCLDLSQGATNLFLMDNIPKEDVSSAAAILAALGIFFLVSAVLCYIRIRKMK